MSAGLSGLFLFLRLSVCEFPFCKPVSSYRRERDQLSDLSLGPLLHLSLHCAAVPPPSILTAKLTPTSGPLLGTLLPAICLADPFSSVKILVQKSPTQKYLTTNIPFLVISYLSTLMTFTEFRAIGKVPFPLLNLYSSSS